MTIVPSDPLCQYDMLVLGDSARERLMVPKEQRRPPCREPAKWIIEEWDDGQDVYLCPRHAQSVQKNNSDDMIELVPV